jgi:hypothetical protein
MAEWDRRPTLNPETGRPHSFLEMPLSTHIDLWHAAPVKLATQSRYAALLVSMHGTALYERRDLDKLEPGEAELVRTYLADSRRRQTALTTELHLDAAQLHRNQRLLWTWDGLSLALCLPWPDHVLAAVPARDGPADLEVTATGMRSFTLDPWPFARDEVRVRCEGRRLEGRFDSEAELHAALARAAMQTLEFTLSHP